MSLTTRKLVAPTAEQIKKFGDKPATANKSAFVAGLRFTLTALGWRELLDEDTNLPVLDKQGDAVVFPVLETSAGEKASISLGLFEPKWDEKLSKAIMPNGPLADFFRAHCTEMTRQQMLTAMQTQFAGKTFETSLVFYNRATKDGKFFKASAPVFTVVG